jgi:hypothetical protein
MQDVERDWRGPFGRTYAEPLAGLRVSWGAVLAGAVAMLAVSVLLVGLALAVISVATRPEAGSLKVSIIALWICAMGATLVGAFVGGLVAGYLPGNPRGAIAVGHGFLAWAVALVVSFAFQLGLMRGIVNTTGGLILDTLAAESASTPDEGMGDVAPPSTGGATPRQYGAAPTRPQGREVNAGRIALDYVIGAGWSWFGTWFVAGLLALAGAAVGRSRVSRVELEDRRIDRDRPIGPLTPAPSA